MKILAINNYSLETCLSASRRKEAPAHHNWGVDFLLIENEVDFLNFDYSRGGIIYYWRALTFCIRYFRRFRKYDVVISFFNPCIGFLAYLKQFGFLKCRLFTLVHHRCRYMLLSSGYDRVFFLSKQIMNLVKKDYPHLSDKMTWLDWGVDLDFYDNYFKKIVLKDIETTPIAISTGKTERDIFLLSTVCEKMNIPYILITDKVDGSFPHVISSGSKGVNSVSYPIMLDYMVKSSISIIPILPNFPSTSLCGLTSFLDALALGQPIIMSDNTNISVDIEKEGIGLIYRAGDEKDLSDKILYMINDPLFCKSCGENARLYAMKHDYKAYCRQLYSFLIK
ncbi:glycosyltransferase [Bacteroides eggerthii]|jgi:glycosyltransferase involved in cell wall biosynthesis|uniref:glycosyltransferase n=1 Tax=Bacteroides eggerthii TaxID=28111 RepID=UPI001C378FCE|nr:glycosyltransferase [Bacteroides eggerthii]MBV3843214.1 glycosyltransferase [Bacteroides eggerthii]MBV3846543.1 glycosyltransferase [Bacteroides eggerthii]MBV3884309.1 glycosyltransferase [Bacteroides eggerthii]MBV3891258.1 glycosyltransferase [Bacteroides eggerthii]MBV3902419.1 glycosyltransferase [Bacteroides eggerthii]